MIYICVVLVALVLTQHGFSGEMNMLHDLRYVVVGERGRVTLSFRGAARYAAERDSNIVTLRFENTRVSSPPGAARLNFAAGGVRRVVIERIGADNASVTLTLRDNTHSSYSSSESGNQLYVDVMMKSRVPARIIHNTMAVPPKKRIARPAFAPSAPVSQRPARPVTGETESGRDPQVGQNKASVVNIARTQDASVESGPKHSNAGIRPPTRQNGTVFAIVISFGSALVGTAGILWFLSRRARAQGNSTLNLTSERTERYERKEVPRPSAAEAAKQGQVHWTAGGREEIEISADEETLHLAESFQRSRGDLDLAFQVSSGAYAHRVQKMLNHGRQVSLTRNQRVIMAKKLGVGMGEFELMAQLGRLKEGNVTKEEVQ